MDDADVLGEPSLVRLFLFDGFGFLLFVGSSSLSLSLLIATTSEFCAVFCFFWRRLSSSSLVLVGDMVLVLDALDLDDDDDDRVVRPLPPAPLPPSIFRKVGMDGIADALVAVADVQCGDVLVKRCYEEDVASVHVTK